LVLQFSVFQVFFCKSNSGGAERGLHDTRPDAAVERSGVSKRGHFLRTLMASDHPHSSYFIFFFKIDYSVFVINLLSFILSFPAPMFLHFLSFIPTTRSWGPHVTLTPLSPHLPPSLLPPRRRGACLLPSSLAPLPLSSLAHRSGGVAVTRGWHEARRRRIRPPIPWARRSRRRSRGPQRGGVSTSSSSGPTSPPFPAPAEHLELELPTAARRSGRAGCWRSTSTIVSSFTVAGVLQQRML
jgi:hypothetical protein